LGLRLAAAASAEVLMLHVVATPGEQLRWSAPIFERDAKVYAPLLAKQVAAAEAYLRRQVDEVAARPERVDISRPLTMVEIVGHGPMTSLAQPLSRSKRMIASWGCSNCPTRMSIESASAPTSDTAALSSRASTHSGRRARCGAGRSCGTFGACGRICGGGSDVSSDASSSRVPDVAAQADANDSASTRRPMVRPNNASTELLSARDRLSLALAPRRDCGAGAARADARQAADLRPLRPA